jgi:catechol 2,3-dioxygenase-like lactoylglutathione lyase family enzyme
MLSKSPVFASLPFRGLRKAKDFYTKKLGLAVKSGSVEEDHIEFSAGKGTVIAVFESGSPKSHDTAATFAVTDLAKEMKALRAKGVKFEEYDLPRIKTKDGVFAMGKIKAAWFKDPGGNVICLLQER